MHTHLLVEEKNNAQFITLNRPDVFNAFNDEMSFELQDTLKKASRNDDVRTVIITGAGKAFCSGQDLKDIKDDVGKRSLSESVHQRYNPIIKAIRGMKKPVICKLNGVAAGAGCSIALACDMIVASEHAKLIEVFINVGLVLDSGSSFFLPRVVGYNKAFELATLGSKISAQQAFDLGIIYKVVSTEELDQETENLVNYYANAPTKAIGLIKSMLNKSYQSSLPEMLEYEAYCQEMAGFSDDYKEGIAAFIEKRKPNYSGK